MLINISDACSNHGEGSNHEMESRDAGEESNIPLTRNCGGEDYMNYLYSNDPSLRPKIELGNLAIEQELQSLSSEPFKRQTSTVLTIPVVVHIIYRTTAQNISDTIIKNQIAILNKDFRRRNTDSDSVVTSFRNLRADTGIQFVLAQTDPQGRATTGITRTLASTTSFPGVSDSSFNDQCKFTARGGIDAWNSQRYMNIWVCSFGGGVLGYATFPGASSSNDGIVINTPFFGIQSNVNQGTYNLGRTLTHEAGHYFNLFHVWGNVENECSEDDRVSDTPIISSATFGCPLTKTSCGNLNMIQNFMDYSDDRCLVMWSVGQSSRMRIELEGSSGRRRALPISYSGSVLGLDDTSTTTTSANTATTTTTGRLTTSAPSPVTTGRRRSTTKSVTTGRRKSQQHVGDEESTTTEDLNSNSTLSDDNLQFASDGVIRSSVTVEVLLLLIFISMLML